MRGEIPLSASFLGELQIGSIAVKCSNFRGGFRIFLQITVFCVRAPSHTLVRRSYIDWAFLCAKLRRLGALKTHHFTVSNCRFRGG